MKNASKVLNGEMNEDGCQYAIYENRHATLHIIMELPWISCLLSNRIYYFHTILHFVFQYIYMGVCVCFHLGNLQQFYSINAQPSPPPTELIYASKVQREREIIT